MRKFLLRLAFFLILAELVAAGAEWLVRSRDNAYSLKDSVLRREGSRFNTLILGSSFAYQGIDPALMGDSVFSLANYSQTPVLDLRLFQKYSPYCPNLKRVVVGIGYQTLEEKPLVETVEWHRVTSYNLQMGLRPQSLNPRYWFELSEPTVFSKRLRARLTGEGTLECDSLGHEVRTPLAAHKGEWDANVDVFVARASVKDDSALEANIQALKELQKLCQERGIELVVVGLPVTSVFRTEMPTDILSRRQQALKEAAPDRFIDFTLTQAVPDTLFADPSHLSSDKGARFFTPLLLDSLRQREQRVR